MPGFNCVLMFVLSIRFLLCFTLSWALGGADYLLVPILNTRYVLPFGWGWVESVMFGGILSATDPVAVIALLKDLGVMPDLSVLIEGESILNDGTSIVLYELCFSIMMEPPNSAGAYGEMFS